MRKFELDYLPPSATTGEYPGAFSPNVDLVIRRLVNGRVLHLFSGTSLIGDERIDIEHPNATLHCDIGEFVESDSRQWDWVILDPPYDIQSADSKLKEYGNKQALSASVPLRRKVIYYLQRHTNNVLWLDLCAPTIKGFYRKKLWLVLTGGFHTVRVLSWLQKEMDLLL